LEKKGKQFWKEKEEKQKKNRESWKKKYNKKIKKNHYELLL
jgi:hypothetical protein